MRFIQFNDKKVDSFLFMELSDLAKTLSKNPEMEVEFGYRSYLDPLQNKIIISHFWDNRPEDDKRNGLLSDIFLRSLGSLSYTDYKEINTYLDYCRKSKLINFAKQLFMLFEDIRLEELCKKERPGTRRTFDKRRAVYRMYFEDQLHVNIVKSVHTDALFNAIFLLITADSPLEDIPPIKQEIDQVLPFIRNKVVSVFDAKNTDHIIRTCKEIVAVLEDVVDQDLLNTYFHLPELDYDLVEEGLNFDDLKRKDKLRNNDTLDDVKKGDEDIHEQKMAAWHRETETPTKSFLQFDLDQGSRTNLLGEGAREGEAGDQALGMVQGSSGKSNNNDFSKIESMESMQTDKEGSTQFEYGRENRFAYPVFLNARKPNHHELIEYEKRKATIAPYQKKLKQMILKTLEHKKNLPRGDLHFGRLNKKLIRIFTDDNPRLFYKKDQPSTQIDAVFSLLVDCSASMHDKMDQTKHGIALFHEALKSVQVPHEVTGFWEDTNDADSTKQPNYFQNVITFDSSLKRSSGAEIMQLEPEEDNRDGFTIRLQTKKLLERSEKQKFLLVFSDGEPAAFDYEQNGIIDTHEAVLAARKYGIEVINVFLSNGDIDEGQQKTIQNIYGKYSILVPNVEQLPDVLFPLLKKLLYKSI
ncbi:vWA domain-containing protein [Fredinandcohnia sp. 179-A 10B2 NHS]|uniref:vWA domain-containing protein n=1 Tax=Fredinandcohnia sp. 179-A 10B2 NHS TaxID=3235176 RepID=UPI0039A08E00